MENSSFLPGALPDHLIAQMVRERFIKNSKPENIKPSSLDLTIDLTTIRQVGCMFLPSKNKSPISRTLQDIGAKSAYAKGETTIKAGSVYVAKVLETIDLSQTSGLFARSNPKSSTGRSDVHVQLMADWVPAYDTIPRGWKGELYVILRPKSFDVLFEDDFVSVNQIRFFQDSRILVQDDDLRSLVGQKILRNSRRGTDLQFSNVIRNGSRVELSLDLRDLGDQPGFIARQGVVRPLVWKTGANDAHDFFDPLKKVEGDKALVFEKDRFYILSSREAVRVPRDYACEMVSFDDTLGEFRSHYAGFIDNGWGENGHRPLTLELRTNENMYMYHGQPIAHVIFDRMCSPVEKTYDEIASNYANQATARLGKFFK